MAHADHTRDPCPVVILNDFGGAFAMGAVGGTIWHGIKGARNAPRGDRFYSSLAAIKARAPVVGGNVRQLGIQSRRMPVGMLSSVAGGSSFGVWGGMFSSFDCAVKGVRGGKEDPANAIIAGFLTGGTLAFRSGPKPMLVSAIGCGLLLGVFEGVGALIGRVFARYNRPVAPLLPEQPQAAQPARSGPLSTLIAGGGGGARGGQAGSAAPA